MDSIYFRDPLGLLVELASYRFEPPVGHAHADVMIEAHLLRTERGDYNIAPIHLADAIERLVARTQRTLSRVVVGRIAPLHLPSPRAISSAGRAPPRQGGGHWFEPSIAHSRTRGLPRSRASSLRSRTGL